jgi:hypothetical protein
MDNGASANWVAGYQAFIGSACLFVQILQWHNTRPPQRGEPMKQTGFPFLIIAALLFTGSIVSLSVGAFMSLRHTHPFLLAGLLLLAFLAVVIIWRLFYAVQNIGETRVTPSTETATTLPIKTAAEALADAQQAVFVEDTAKLSVEDFRLATTYDREFKAKLDAIPSGAYPKIDALRIAISRDPIIEAEMVQSGLLPRSIWADTADELFKIMKKTPYERTSDFLFEIHVVNVSHNPTTIKNITAQVEIEGHWVDLEPADINRYELSPVNDKLNPLQSLEQGEELQNLWSQIKGVRLDRGVGYQGWVAFELKAPNTVLEKPVIHRVRLIDALGGVHPVMTIGETKKSGRLRHSKKGREN